LIEIARLLWLEGKRHNLEVGSRHIFHATQIIVLDHGMWHNQGLKSMGVVVIVVMVPMHLAAGPEVIAKIGERRLTTICIYLMGER
jgi:hypothetical protein